MQKKIISLFLALSTSLISIPAVIAHCPLCTGAVGAAAISAKYYGLDISIIGMLLGAFGISTGLWVGRKVGKYVSAIVLVSFLLTIIPLQAISNETVYLPVLLFGSAGSLLNKVYWVNKILVSGFIGGLVSLIAFWLHIAIKKFNGRVLFPFQGIAITLASLAVASIGLHLLHF